MTAQTLIQRIDRARACFTANPSLTVLFVTLDGQCFKKDQDAHAQAKYLIDKYSLGTEKDYYQILKTSLTVIDAILADTSNESIDSTLNGSTDPVLVGVADYQKKNNDQDNRVVFKSQYFNTIPYEGDYNFIDICDMLKYGEDDPGLLVIIENARQHYIDTH